MKTINMSDDSGKIGLVPGVFNGFAQLIADTSKGVSNILKPLDVATNNLLHTISNPKELFNKNTYKKLIPFLGATLAHEFMLALRLPFASIRGVVENFVAQNADRLGENGKAVTTNLISNILKGESPGALRAQTLGRVASILEGTGSLLVSGIKYIPNLAYKGIKIVDNKISEGVDKTSSSLYSNKLYGTPYLNLGILTSVANDDNFGTTGKVVDIKSAKKPESPKVELPKVA